MAENVNDVRRSADYTARTVHEAVERAAADLRIPSDQIEYTIVKDSSHTILGLVRTGEATIRVWLPSPSRPAPLAAPPELQRPAVVEDEEESRVGESLTGEELDDDEDLEDDEDDEDEELDQEYEEDAYDEDLDEDEENGEEVAVAEAAPPPARARPVGEADLVRITSEVVSRLLDGMGLLAAVEIVDRGGQVDPDTKETAPLQVNVLGDDLGSLIGRRGETLRDFQFLTRLIVSRKVGRWPNIVVDVEGYKARRVDALRALALRMSDRVRQTGQAVVLEPMPAHERRIVHLALRDATDVYTESMGEGESRKVQILPK